MLSPTDLQLQTLRLYGELLSQRDIWGGKLIFTSGPGSSACGLPAAASIAGGTTLVLDPDATSVKAVFRQGGIDFVVNTLDEALRVLKNEIRQHKPLSVALIAPIQPVLDEIASRGLAPDLQVSFDPPSNPLLITLPPEPLLPGIPQLHLANAEGIAAPTAALEAWLAAQSLTETIFEIPSEHATTLRDLDARLLSLIPADDTLRRRWLQRIPHYQRPSTTPARVLWLTHAEREALSTPR